jgi:hypothetical protein
MKKMTTLSLGAALAVAALASFMSNSTSALAQGGAAKPYRHLVLFKFKDGTDAAKVDEVVTAFKALPGKLPAIRGFEWGKNVSPENHAQGLTHCFTLTFESKEALEKHYLHEPAHKEFGAMLGPILDKVVVVDYVAE